MKGDINNDGLVNQEDAKLLKDAILGKFKLNSKQRDAADFNFDNKITLTDLIALNNLLKSKIAGDANGDGSLTEDDVKVIQKHIASLIKLDGRLLENADVNKDGVVNMRDVTFLQRLLAGIIAENK